MFQLTGDRCENLDGFSVGDEVRVEFQLRGREWQSPQGETKYFNSLDTWKIDRIDMGTVDKPNKGAETFVSDEEPLPF